MSYLAAPTGSDRRLDPRARLELFMNEIVREKECRALATNLSDHGLLIQKLAEPVTRHARFVGVEFELPGTNEIIWARAESRFDWIDENFHFTGLHFVAMARSHERLVRDWVYDKRRRDHDSLWLRHKMARLTIRPS